MPEFLAETLTSRDLLALLFILESERKGGGDWETFAATFLPRLANLGETVRFEVLQAHLMSVEDLDIYDDALLRETLNARGEALSRLGEQIRRDARFNAGT